MLYVRNIPYFLHHFFTKEIHFACAGVGVILSFLSSLFPSKFLVMPPTLLSSLSDFLSRLWSPVVSAFRKKNLVHLRKTRLLYEIWKEGRICRQVVDDITIIICLHLFDKSTKCSVRILWTFYGKCEGYEGNGPSRSNFSSL